MAARIILKHKHDEWKSKLERIGKPQEIVSLLINPDETRKRVTNLNPGLDEGACGDVVDLLNHQTSYSDYHGIGVLDTDLFMVIVETFPPRTEPYVWTNYAYKELHDES